MNYLPQMAKALVGMGIAFVGSLSVALVGDQSFGDLTDGQWIASVLAGLVALGGVWATPNRQP